MGAGKLAHKISLPAMHHATSAVRLSCPQPRSCLQFGHGREAQSEAGKKGGERAKELHAGVVSGAACCC
jgi:hypothetical protein